MTTGRHRYSEVLVMLLTHRPSLTKGHRYNIASLMSAIVTTAIGTSPIPLHKTGDSYKTLITFPSYTNLVSDVTKTVRAMISQLWPARLAPARRHLRVSNLK